jgi:hypothetical protein
MKKELSMDDKEKMLQDTFDRIKAHYAKFEDELGEYAPKVPASLKSDLASEVKGLKAAKSIKDKLEKALQREIFDADFLANRVRENKKVIEKAISLLGVNLWPDAPRLCVDLSPNVLRDYVEQRVSDYAKTKLK